MDKVLSKVRLIFTSPTFEDEDKSRIANLLSVILLIMFTIAVIRTILAIGAAPKYLTIVLESNGILLIVFAGIYTIMRIGYVRLACIIFTFYQWIAVAWICYQYGGITLSIYSFFIFVIIASGLLLGGKWAVGYALISIIYGIILLILENMGMIIPLREGPIEVFSTITPSFITTAVLVYLYHRDMTDALIRARTNAIQLTDTNEQLNEEIATRKQVEERLFQVQKMEAIGRLSGGIAHDFNNLLVPIIGYVELAMMDLSPDSKLYANLVQIKEAGDRAANITQQILAFSRQQVLKIEILNLNEVIVNFQKMIQQLIRENIKLNTVFEKNIHNIKADKAQIEQVLMNLIINASDAMPDGGKLTIKTENIFLDETKFGKFPDHPTPGDYVILEVKDTGHGMDAETKKLIFEPFFTTKEREKGTGLGLATVFGIIKQHHGNIIVESKPGKGTIFKIYIPKAESKDITESVSAPESSSTRGTETILVVEDEKTVRKFVCEILQTHGYKIMEAKTPAEALKLVTSYKDKIHLLLTDVIMPGMNGLELYKKIILTRSDIKVMYMSGYTDDVMVNFGMPKEDIHLLQKPFKVNALTKMIRQVLD